MPKYYDAKDVEIRIGGVTLTGFGDGDFIDVVALREDGVSELAPIKAPNAASYKATFEMVPQSSHRDVVKFFCSNGEMFSYPPERFGRCVWPFVIGLIASLKPWSKA